MSAILVHVPGLPAPQGSKRVIPGWAYCKACGASRARPRPNPQCSTCNGSGRRCYCGTKEESKRLAAWRAQVEAALRRVYFATPPAARPARGAAVNVPMVFVFARPASHVGKTGLTAAGRRAPFPTSHQLGDRDKLERAVGDAITGVALEDDSDIVGGEVVKRYLHHEADAGLAGLYFAVEEATGDRRRTPEDILNEFDLAIGDGQVVSPAQILPSAQPTLL